MTFPEAAAPLGRGKDVLVEFPQDELIAKWEEFFEEMGYLSKIIAIADRFPEDRSLLVAFDELNRFDTDMAIFLLRHPLNVLTAGEEAIRRLVPPGEEATQIHLRIRILPRDRRVPIRDLRAKHLGQYIAVEGLVRKSTEVRPRVTDALFQCLRCGTIIKEPQDGQNFREPLECYEEQGGCKRSASATKFRLMTETSLYLDTQKLEIQESPEGLRGGAEPQRLTLYLEDDLTGRITPGERLIMNGVLRSVQKGRPGAKSTLFDIFMDVNSVEKEQVEFEEIEVTEDDARLIRDAGASPDIFRMITASIAPSLYGMHVEKEALALQLFSGVPKLMPDGRRIRGDIHVLMVGDPGVGKSELLSYMSRLSPRGIYATGKAASAAGLTAAAVRDEFGEGRWTLEAGALVLADLGLAAIDEIEKMNPQDRSAIHEAMEQQRISVAKAGITAVLQARCAVLAAANPKFGRFDEHKYISEQIDLPPALLSRFDIIFSMIDRPQSDRDRELAEHVLKGHRVGEIRRRREAGLSSEETQALEEPYTPHFNPDFLRKYVAYAKRLFPVMTEEAMGIIERKYLEIRKTGEAAGSSVPITPRQLEAIIRLSEAGARLRLSESVTADDAERAVRITEYWMGKVAGEEGRFDIDIIQTGISQSQREQIISIRDIINELAGPDGVADYEDIVRLAQERGIPPAKVDSWLKRWAQEGEIYSPVKNKYKLVERL
ncbi:MAG: minichromosome maintenance protein MCM [Methanobacteriota archaeon]|nr:MAG: minichromosome maintenance protein MCM [Euryarchaeota archaeon]TLZ67112.1 MAG: minichromosome maintenance protein MCM [Euryarchaeota archaeon]